MKFAYRVKQGAQIVASGTTYLQGQIVYLTREEALIHAPSIERVSDTVGDSDPPFEVTVRAYRGQDISEVYYLYLSLAEIDTAVVLGNQTTITTKTPHGLATGGRCIVWAAGDFPSVGAKTVATAIDAKTITVPEALPIGPPGTREFAEVAIPWDLTGSALSGGIYANSTDLIQHVNSVKATTVLNSPRVALTGTLEELKSIKVNDDCRITGAVVAFAKVLDVGDPLVINCQDCCSLYTMPILLNANATAVVTATDQVTWQRSVLNGRIGALTQAATFSGALQYGEVIARIESTSLPAAGSYAFQIFRELSGNDILLFLGSAEVIN